jgi:uncharacterized protein YecE (DUF72 family)
VAATERIEIGTSGWSYDHWRHVFYPDRLPPEKRLEFYARHFPTVEINATFYRLPSEHAVKLWRDEVPDEFEFAVKGSQFITHYRRLKDAEQSLQVFFDRVGLLGEKLKVVLWQLPARMVCDAELLDGFLGELPREMRHAVEFRNQSWLVGEVFEVLRKHNVAQVTVSGDEMPVCVEVTADFVYVRFHGTAEYHGAYTHPALEPWAEFLRREHERGLGGYAYFNNDAQAHAPADAERLIGMLAGTAETVREVMEP